MDEKTIRKAGDLLVRRAQVIRFRDSVGYALSFSYPTITVGHSGDLYTYAFQAVRAVNRSILTDALQLMVQEEIDLINIDLKALGVSTEPSK